MALTRVFRAALEGVAMKISDGDVSGLLVAFLEAVRAVLALIRLALALAGA